MNNSTLGPEISNFIDSIRTSFGGFAANVAGSSASSQPSELGIRRAVLTLLVKESQSAADVVSSLKKLSAGTWEPSDSEIYPLLEELSLEGLVESRVQKKTKVFSTTALGEAWLAEKQAEPDQPEPQAKSSWSTSALVSKTEFAKASALLANAIAGIALTSDHAKLNEASDRLNSTAKSLFSMLSEDK